MTQGKSESELIEAFDRNLAEHAKADRQVFARLFGERPYQLPEPVMHRIRDSIAVLRHAGQSKEQICQLVTDERDNRLAVPGSAGSGDAAIAFYDAVNYLAHVQWALGLDKASALKVLAGDLAAAAQQRSKRGTESQFGSEEKRQARNMRIRELAGRLQQEEPNLSLGAIIGRLAAQFGLSQKQIRRILGASL